MVLRARGNFSLRATSPARGSFFSISPSGGEGDVADEHARTFDAEMPAKLGASGVESDSTSGLADGDEQASQQGNAEAA